MREQLNANIGSKIKVSFIEKDFTVLKNIRLNISSVNYLKCIIKEDDFISLIYNTYNNNIFNPNQTFIIDYNGETLKINIDTDIVGYITFDTIINIETNDRMIIIEKTKNN